MSYAAYLYLPGQPVLEVHCRDLTTAQNQIAAWKAQHGQRVKCGYSPNSNRRNE
jgi:hypothetical protein